MGWFLYADGTAHHRTSSGGETPADCGLGDYPERYLSDVSLARKCATCARVQANRNAVRSLVQEAIDDVFGKLTE